MKRTSPLNLVLTAIGGGFLAWFLEAALVTSGRPTFVPPYTLGVALLLIGVIVVVMAIPVNRVVRGKISSVDPFYATRVVVLAKASSVTGALLGGAGLGIAGFLLTRSVVPGVGSITMAFVAAGGAILLLAGGLIAEAMCVIPPPDDDAKSDPTVPSRGAP